MPKGSRDSEVAIVTGGSAGIGRAVARALARSGRIVVISGRDEARLVAAADAISRETGTEVGAYRADASSTVAMREAVSDTLDRYGRLDVIVNNAGMGRVIPIAETTDAALELVFRTNVFGPAAVIGAAWAHLVERRRGCIVNISSWAALDPFPGFFLYAATKSALNSMTRSVHNEGREHGIRAFTIGPGAVETDLLRSAFGESIVPREACLRPDEVAALVMDCVEGRRDADAGRCLYICRDSASGGVQILADGGPQPR